MAWITSFKQKLFEIIKACWKQKGCFVALLLGQQITYDLKSSEQKLYLSIVYNRNKNWFI